MFIPFEHELKNVGENIDMCFFFLFVPGLETQIQQRKHITVSRSRNFFPWQNLHLLGSTESGVLRRAKRNRSTNLQASLFNLCKWTNRSGRKGFSLPVSSEFKTSRAFAALVALREFFGTPEERNDITLLNEKREHFPFLFQSTGLRWLLAGGVFIGGGGVKIVWNKVTRNTFFYLSRYFYPCFVSLRIYCLFLFFLQFSCFANILQM